MIPCDFFTGHKATAVMHILQKENCHMKIHDVKIDKAHEYDNKRYF